MRRLLPILIAACLISPMALGKDSSSGCGPAWYVLKDNSLVSSFLRVITNGILSPVVTLGMTFGTSNCSKHSIVDNSKQSEHFAMVTFDNLRQDVAKGNGPFLDAYAETFQCSPDIAPQFRAHLQNHYSVIFDGAPEPQDVVERTKNVLQKSQQLAGLCSAV